MNKFLKRKVEMKSAPIKFSIAKRIPDQVSCDLSGEAVKLNLNSGMYFGLDEIGARIWAALEEPRSLEYLGEIILRDYQVDRETCERDVMAFLAELQFAGLIEIDNGAVA
jgi:hypothetical protein